MCAAYVCTFIEYCIDLDLMAKNDRACQWSACRAFLNLHRNSLRLQTAARWAIPILNIESWLISCLSVSVVILRKILCTWIFWDMLLNWILRIFSSCRVAGYLCALLKFLCNSVDFSNLMGKTERIIVSYLYLLTYQQRKHNTADIEKQNISCHRYQLLTRKILHKYWMCCNGHQSTAQTCNYCRKCSLSQEHS